MTYVDAGNQAGHTGVSGISPAEKRDALYIIADHRYLPSARKWKK
jgi:hypothetical protein